MRQLWFVLVVLGVAMPALAGPLEILGDPLVTPTARADALAQVCAQPPPTLPEAVPALLGSPVRAVRIAGARLALCQPSAELVPALYVGFHREKAAPNADPDVYERLLRALQALPPAVVRARLEDGERGLGGAAHEELLGLAWTRLHRNWLAPLGYAGGGPGDGRDDSEAQRAASDWLARVLDGPDGLVRLQTDSGDFAFVFMERLQGWHLAALIADGGPGDLALAVQVCRQSSLCDVRARDALRSRVGVDPALVDALDGLGQVTEDPAQSGLPPRPVVPLTVAPHAMESVIVPTERIDAWVWVVGGVGLFWGLWILIAGVRPGARRGLFRVGAVALAPTLLVGAEGVLGLLGVQPLAWRAEGQWSEPAALRGTTATGPLLIEETRRGGEPWLDVINQGARWTSLPADQGDGTWRIALLGESSVHGSNHLAEEAFGEILAARLGALRPARGVEVLNAGIGGAVSDDVLRAGREALDAGADLLVLYHGVNDIGRMGALAGLRAFSSEQLAVRILLDESRVVAVLSAVVPDRLREAWATPEGGAALDEEPEASPDQLRQLAALRCTRNQQRLALEARSRGVPVIVVAQALIDRPDGSQPAEAPYLLGIAERTASATGATLIDGQAVLRADAAERFGGAAAGVEYFWDDVHPSRLGHAVLGETLAPTALRLLEGAESR